MSYSDFNLRHFQQTSPFDAEINILIQFEPGRLSEIEELGFRTTSVAGNIAAGEIRLSQLRALQEHPAVLVLERGDRTRLKPTLVMSRLICSTRRPTRTQFPAKVRARSLA